MSLADTAALVSSLELRDKFTPTVNKYDKALAGMERTTTGFGKTATAVGGHVSAGIGSAIKNVERLGLAAGALLASQVKFGIDSLQKLDDVVTQTNAVIRSTHGAAGESAKAIRDLALKYEGLNAVIDDKVIQSGENLLLTFTNIDKKAFEPALLATLNLNQALGGGEAGLQGTIIQVGKALNDPIKGLTALRRVGVSFTADEQKQIKTLVAHNNLYGAQKIILGELTKQFGGSFATAGQTATGKFAKLTDAIDDAQQALATAFLPALTEVADTLSTFLRDPATVAAIKDFGTQLAGGFKTAFEWVKKLDFKSIGNTLKSAAGFAGTLIQKFMDAPAWLQTAVVTGWGLNKLTGGALTNIGGDLLKGIGGQFLQRGSSALNPLFVKDVTGGLGVGPGAKGGILGTLGSIVMKVAIVGMVAEVADLIHGVISPGGGLEGRMNGQGGGLLPADQLSWPFGPKNTPHVDLGPIKNIFGGDSAFTVPVPVTSSITGGSGGTGFGGGSSAGGGGGIGTIGGGMNSGAGWATVIGDLNHMDSASSAFTQSIKDSTNALKSQAAIAKDTSWLTGLKKGIQERSAAKYGGTGLGASAVSATYQRDILGRARSIEKSSASAPVKLERMKALLAGATDATTDTKRVLSGDIKGLKTAVTKVKPPIVSTTVNVNTEVSANAVVTKYKSTSAYGSQDPLHKHGGDKL